MKKFLEYWNELSGEEKLFAIAKFVIRIIFWWLLGTGIYFSWNGDSRATTALISMLVFYVLFLDN